MEEEEKVSTRKTKAKGYNIESEVTWFVLHPLDNNPNVFATLAKHDNGVVLNVAVTKVPGSEKPEDIVSTRTVSLSTPEFLAIKKVIESW